MSYDKEIIITVEVSIKELELIRSSLDTNKNSCLLTINSPSSGEHFINMAKETIAAINELLPWVAKMIQKAAEGAENDLNL